jgi:hypothetical protein
MRPPDQIVRVLRRIIPRVRRNHERFTSPMARAAGDMLTRELARRLWDGLGHLELGAVTEDRFLELLLSTVGIHHLPIDVIGAAVYGATYSEQQSSDLHRRVSEMPRKTHNHIAHHARCAKPGDDTHKICPLAPDPDLEIPQVDTEKAGGVTLVTFKTSTWDGRRGEQRIDTEYLDPDEAMEFASQLMRAAQVAKAANDAAGKS